MHFDLANFFSKIRKKSFHHQEFIAAPQNFPTYSILLLSFQKKIKTPISISWFGEKLDIAENLAVARFLKIILRWNRASITAKIYQVIDARLFFQEKIAG